MTHPIQIGPYRVGEAVGRGGMGLVYRVARDGTQLALKLLNSAPTDRLSQLRFEREFATVAALAHPVLVPVHEWGEHEGQPYYTMDWVSGPSLTAFLEARRGQSDWAEELHRVVGRLLEGLAYVHSNWVVHRDLKPDNVLVDASGPRLLDFGLAYVTNTNRLTDPGVIMGTAYYMSPEQIMGEELDARSDLYSLGAVLYELWTGHVPFDSEEVLNVLFKIMSEPPPPLEDAPEPVASLILKLLAKHPADRFGSAQEVLWAWNQAFGHAPPASAAGARPDLFAPRFSGRAAELAQLQQHASAGGVLILEGVSGIGKTRLLSELDPTNMVWSTCQEGGTVPYQPWLPALGRAARGGLPDQLTSFKKSLAALLPELGRVGLAPQKLHLFEGMLRLLAWAAPPATLLVLDDLQWADEVSLEFLSYLSRALLAWEEEQRAGPRPPLALVVSLASEERDRLQPMLTQLEKLGARRLALEPLSIDDSTAMAASMWGSSLDSQLCQRLYQETEGNPLFICEMLKALADGSSLKTRPDSIREVISRRLAGMDSATLEVARLAALLGRTFDFELLSQAYEGSDAALLEALERLRRRRILKSQRGAYAFDSQAVWELLSEASQPAQQARVAQALERVGAAPERLANHWRLAGDSQRAATHLLRAAHEAVQLFAFPRAVELYELASQLGSSDQEGLADALFGAQRTEEARALYASLPPSPRLDRKLGVCWERAGELEQALVHLVRALEAQGMKLASRSLASRLRLTAEVLKRMVRKGGSYGKGREQAAELHLLSEHILRVTFFLRQPGWEIDLLDLSLRHRSASDLLQDRAAEAQSKILWTWYCLMRARPPLSRVGPQVVSCLELLRQLSNSPFKAAGLRDVGYMLFLTGNPEGIWITQEAAALAADLGDLSVQSLCTAALMLMARETGRADLVDGYARRYRELLEVTGSRMESILVELAVAMLEAYREEGVAARQAYERAEALWTRSPGAFLVEQREMTLAWVLLAEGRFGEARQQAARAQRLLKGGENYIYLMEVRMAEAWAAIEEGLPPARARRYLARFQAGADLTPNLTITALDLEARLLVREGHPQAAAQGWQAAVERARELECPLPEGRCHLQLALLWADSHPGRAQEHRHQALVKLSSAGAGKALLQRCSRDK